MTEYEAMLLALEWATLLHCNIASYDTGAHKPPKGENGAIWALYRNSSNKRAITQTELHATPSGSTLLRELAGVGHLSFGEIGVSSLWPPQWISLCWYHYCLCLILTTYYSDQFYFVTLYRGTTILTTLLMQATIIPRSPICCELQATSLTRPFGIQRLSCS